MNYVLPEETVKTILVYLYKRPYQEVAQLISLLSQLKPADSKKEESAKTKQ